MKAFLLSAASVCIVLGSISCSQQPSYEESLATIPPPVDDGDRQRKCAWIRSEMARQQNIAQYGSATLQGPYAMAVQMNARNNTAALESRASDFGCYAAFSNNRPAPSGIEDCTQTCKANTSRTSEQCFDSCNH